MGKITIILASVCVLLGFWCWCLQKENTRLYAEKNALSASIAKFNEAREKTAKTVVEIRERIKYVKEDCYNMPIPDHILMLVRGE